MDPIAFVEERTQLVGGLGEPLKLALLVEQARKLGFLADRERDPELIGELLEVAGLLLDDLHVRPLAVGVGNPQSIAATESRTDHGGALTEPNGRRVASRIPRVHIGDALAGESAIQRLSAEVYGAGCPGGQGMLHGPPPVAPPACAPTASGASRPAMAAMLSSKRKKVSIGPSPNQDGTERASLPVAGSM